MARASRFGHGGPSDAENDRLMSDSERGGLPMGSGSDSNGGRSDRLAMLKQEHHKQNELLDALADSAEALEVKTGRIHEEIRAQTDELGDMKADMSSLTSRVSLLNERIAVFVRRNGGWGSCGAICCLSVILFVLIIIVIMGS